MSYLRKIELRIGTIMKAEPFPRARNPSYKIQVDFGKLGVRKTSAQLPLTYPNPEEIVGKQVIAVCNFPRKNIAGFMSEFLTVGFPNLSSKVHLMNTRHQLLPNGSRVGFFHNETDESPAEITFADFEEAEICTAKVNEITSKDDGGCSVILDCGNEKVASVDFAKCFKNENLVGSLIAFSPKDNVPLFVDPGDGSYFLLGVDKEDEVAPGAKLY